MNPIFILLVFIAAFFVWVGIAFLFPRIGEFFRDYFDAMKGIMDEDDDDEL